MKVNELAIVALIVLSATLVFVHVRLVVSGLRSDRLGTRSKVVTVLIPFLTPFLAWHAGRRVEPILWFVTIATYVTIRILVSVSP